ncbi:hypothetical protein K474DRAFT_1666615 [Panus rudis PR-1116 ss-1]|nr:hypothetical protein K474DRAFT_1666615 [Panus rudis PR-1116 ss-1]
MAYCDRCDRWFKSPSALYQHKVNSGSHHWCSDCDRDFVSEWALIQHYVQSRAHSYCQRCDEHFQDDEELEEHYEEAHWYCRICETIFNSELGLHEHNRQKHWYCVSCKRVFQNENNLKQHLRSAAHQPKIFACPGRNCDSSFISRAALVLHLESGTCPAGATRQTVNKVALQIDRGRILTNPARMIEYGGGGTSTTWATERSWNGYAYECILCHREFQSLKALNAHLQSPAHEGKMYRCPQAWSGCGNEFRTASALIQHVESGSCGVTRFKSRMDNAIDSLASKMKMLTF